MEKKKFPALIAKLIDISFTFSNLSKQIKSFKIFPIYFQQVTIVLWQKNLNTTFSDANSDFDLDRVNQNNKVKTT